MFCSCRIAVLTTVLAAISACGLMTDARALSAKDLEGVNIETAVTYAMRVKRPQGTFTPEVTMTMKFAVKDGVVVGTFTRSSQSPAGKRTTTNKMHAPLGLVGKPASGGEGRWSIEDDKLVLLRTFVSGGFRAEIAFQGRGADMTCTIRAPFVREPGKGPIQTQDAPGGPPITILEATQKLADCKIVAPRPE
jgi:hypothetical protein